MLMYGRNQHNMVIILQLNKFLKKNSVLAYSWFSLYILIDFSLFQKLLQKLLLELQL